MALARWDPFQDLMPLRSVMNELLEQSLVRPERLRGLMGTMTALPLDVYAENDHYVIEAALPGLSPENVNVSVLGSQVTITGEYPAADEKRNYLFREHPVGRFERTITLPTELDADAAQARYEHGLLRLTVPKAAAARPRRITVTASK